MSQNLITLTAFNPPTNPTQSAQLSANIAAINNLDNRQLVALCVLGKIHEFFAVGFDYRNNHNQLRLDAAGFFGGFSFVGSDVSPFLKAMTVMEWYTGKATDPTFSSNVNALIAEMGYFREMPENTLWQMYFYIKYKLCLIGV